MSSRELITPPTGGVNRWILPALLALILSSFGLAASAAVGNAGWKDLSPCPANAVGQEPPELQAGTALERELAGGQEHVYRLSMAEGQYAAVTVEQRGIDIRIRLYGVDRKLIAEGDHESRNRGLESVEFIAEKSGSYLLEIQPTLKTASAARYELRLDTTRLATERDRLSYERAKLRREATELFQARKYDAAITASERILNLVQNSAGADSGEYAGDLDFLGSLYFAKEDYSKAESIYQRALEIREKALGPEHPDVAGSLQSLAILYRAKGNAQKSQSFIERALGIRERALDSDHFLTASTLLEYGKTLSSTQDYVKAGDVYRRAISILKKSLGDGSKEYSNALHSLGNLYEALADFDKAEETYRLELACVEKSNGKDSLEVAFVLDYIARIYYMRGRYDEAESLYQRNVETRRKENNENGVLAALGNLALVRYARGDLQGSEDLYKQVLELREKSGRASPTWVSRNLLNIGAINNEKGDYERGEQYLKRALGLIENMPDQDRKTRFQADIFSALADSYMGKGNYKDSEESIRRALAIYEKTNGPNHPWVAGSLTQLGRLTYLKGDSNGAEPLYLRALQIFEASEGPGSPDTLLPLNNLAALYAAKGDIPRALDFQNRANAVDERKLALALATGSEQQKLAYLASSALEIGRTVTFNIRNAPDDAKASEAAAIAVLRFKGRVLDAMTDTVALLRRRASKDDLTLLGQLNETTARLSYRVLNASGSVMSPDSQAEIKALELKKAELEDQMSRRSAEFRVVSQPVSLDSIQKAIPDKAALIEFAEYRPWDPKAVNERQMHESPRYVAYIIRQDSGVAWRDLGATTEIDRAVDALREALRDPRRKDAQQLARVVDQKLMEPIRPLLSGATQLLISPDGELNLIPYEALVDEQGRYLIERYSISYLTSGRDLLRMHLGRESTSPALVIGAPTFGEPEVQEARETGSGAAARLASRGRRSVTTGDDLSSVYFAPLASTAEEARAIKSLLHDGTLLTGAQATKSALKNVDSPRILHIATHGFFLRDAESDPTRSPGGAGGTRSISARIRSNNPLLRSGLALAGANLKSTTSDNGILTAMEASGLNLRGTRLVTLSACDTGIGEVKTGEGVYGLRRAFVLAGAESLVMSLWPVSDYVTREMMTDYYRGLRQGLGRSEGLRQVKLAMLKRRTREHPFYWASFIQSGEWTGLDERR